MASLSQSLTSSVSSHVPIIFVEGGIGCGKSTLVRKIQEHCEKFHLRILTIQEPVDIWMTIKDRKNGKNMIEAFYEDQHKYSFPFQMMAYISRLERIQGGIKEASSGKYDIIICERSLQTDRNVFCKMLYDEGKIDDYGYAIYNKWFDYFNNFSQRSHYVYLKTDYEICHQRVCKRNRGGEDVISKEYLKNNNEYHNKWLLHDDKCRVLVLNGNVDDEMDPNVHQKHIDCIFTEFIHYDLKK